MAGLRWCKSSRSTQISDCVEVGCLSSGAAVRDSKNPTGPVLTFQQPAFSALMSAAKSGRLDRA
ncbi:DUF397 domain-containing protein [Longimycelium tulufanense]|uniref:DUF397 domain-containing protein n=1 Tax=Longimycelium tulufanense TaxID=907463 RepID=A0A8J3FU40_9PSEU|nr:DUF397 domain-containing protein [Longimycelium tulufanense]GGM55093.1 DUF397 domain-containing protein [Longimycelium tulufanense]